MMKEEVEALEMIFCCQVVEEEAKSFFLQKA
jgi:hypothetical protein